MTTTKKPRTKKSTIEYTYVLKVISKGRTSHGGFVWPTEGVVTAPDWAATAECGRGLHGWLLGVGDVTVSGDRHSDPKAIWLVLKVNKADIVDLGGKVKFPTCEVVFTGNRDNAITEIVKYGALHENIMYGTVTASGNSGKATASGDYGNATASGNYGTANASGNYGTANASGDYGNATASGNSGNATASGNSGKATASGNSGNATASGNSGKATASGNSGKATASGYYGNATASGYYGNATASGNYGTANASGDGGTANASGDGGTANASGYYGKASAGPNGSIILSYHDGTRSRTTVVYVGEDGIEPNVLYTIRYGKVTKVKS